MSNDPQDIFLFFLVAIVWQIFSHFVRDLMLSYYLSNGYGYDAGNVYLPDKTLFNLGLGDLTFRRTDKTFPLSFLADLTYHLSCFVVPCSIMMLFYGTYVDIDELDLKLFLWIAVNFILAIPLNAHRYNKHKHKLKEYRFTIPESLKQYSFALTTDRPLLEIYADQEESHRAQVNMERSAKISCFIAFTLAATLLYLILNEIDGLRLQILFLCLLSAFVSWVSYKTTPIFLKEYQELPLLYSLYTNGFISHRDEKEYSWYDIAKINYSKMQIRLELIPSANCAPKFKFAYISNASRVLILQHFKMHAPKLMTGRIKL